MDREGSGKRACSNDRAKHAADLLATRPPELVLVTEGDLAQLRAYQRNIDRYVRLLRTHLSDHERQYIKKRLAEERALVAGFPETFAAGNRVGAPST
jgi:hypothetical protein